MSCRSTSALILALCVAACAGGEADWLSAAPGPAPSATAPGTSGTSAPDASVEPEVFIAFERDFQGYQKWNAFYIGEETPSPDELQGPRTVYIKSLPPADRKAFPIGTMIVKAVQVGAPSTWPLFGMVKRGQGYNSQGSVDWERFVLTQTDDRIVTINWRGIGPPIGSAGYGGGQKGGTCNDCHGEAKPNDYVQTPALRLAK